MLGETLLAGTVVGGKFRIAGPIGAGGMGTVYEAEQLSIGRRVALKLMRPSLGSKDSVSAFERRFFLEASLCAKLSHPNIVTIYDYGEAGDVGVGRATFYIAMELIEGDTLERLLARRGRLPAREAIAIAIDVAKGLKQAHQSGIVHRDLKPANIMVARDDDGATLSKILDFGLVTTIAAPTAGRLTIDGGLLGTPHYMSPEQAFSRELTTSTDLYSLGVILYEALSGDVPFDGDDALLVAMAQGTKPPLELTTSDCPGLATLVGRLLSKRPAHRPDSADAVLRELRQLQRDIEGTRVALAQVDTNNTYRVSRCIERRTFSEAYEGRHIDLSRNVSVHVHSGDVADPAAVLAELTRVAALRHPAFPRVLDVGVSADGSRPFVVTEESTGPTLRRIVATETIDEARVIRYGLELLEAIEEAHRAGLVHGGINLDSVVLAREDDESPLRLVDFVDRAMGLRASSGSASSSRQREDVLAIVELMYAMRQEKTARASGFSKKVESMLSAVRSGTSGNGVSQVRSALRSTTTPTAWSISVTPVVWVFGGDPAIDRLAVFTLPEALRGTANVRTLAADEREAIAASLDEAQDELPAVVVFGELSVVLEDPLLRVIASAANTQRILVSKSLSADLLQRSVNYCGVNRHLCLPLCIDDLKREVATAVGRARVHAVRALRLGLGPTPGREPSFARSSPRRDATRA